MTYCSSSVVSVQSLVQTWDFLFILESSQTSPFLSTVQHIGYLQQKRQHKVQKLLTSLTDRDIVMQTSLIYTTNIDFSTWTGWIGIRVLSSLVSRNSLRLISFILLSSIITLFPLISTNLFSTDEFRKEKCMFYANNTE